MKTFLGVLECTPSSEKEKQVATFEQALEKAFEVAWRHSEDLDTVVKAKGNSTDHMDELLTEGARQTYIGAVDVLGSLLLLAGRIGTFEMSPPVKANGEPGKEATGWIEGSSLTSVALVNWALTNGRIPQDKYDLWMTGA